MLQIDLKISAIYIWATFLEQQSAPASIKLTCTASNLKPYEIWLNEEKIWRDRTSMQSK